MYPYLFPLVGNLIQFLNGPAELTSNIIQNFGSSTPVQIRLGPLKAYIVSNVNHFDLLLRGKNIRGLKSEEGIMLGMKLLFGLLKKDEPFYDADNSGISHIPAPSSNTLPKHRIHYLRHSASGKYLNGPILRDMTERFVGRLGHQIAGRQDIGCEWIMFPDFSDFVQKELFRAAVFSMCGPNMLSLNPDFIDDFCDYSSYLPVYARAVPRCLHLKAYSARDKLLQVLKRWHRFAREHSGFADDGNVMWEPYWGARLMKERDLYASEMEGMTVDSRASEDLGLLFAMNANAVPATIWFCLHFFRDPTLLSRVRHEVSNARFGSTGFNITTLCQGPLLQSLFAETLSLYMGVTLMRSSDQDFTLDRWHFQKHRLIFLSSRTVHLNSSAYNTGTLQDPHPLDQFWPDRFLVYPQQCDDEKGRSRTEDQPRFSTEGLAGCWVPFGGGSTLCPGRVFAKNEMIASFAMISAEFDVELVTPEADIVPDMRFYSIGMLPPRGKIPFRIRRRHN